MSVQLELTTGSAIHKGPFKLPIVAFSSMAKEFYQIILIRDAVVLSILGIVHVVVVVVVVAVRGHGQIDGSFPRRLD